MIRMGEKTMRHNHCGLQSAKVVEKTLYFDRPIATSSGEHKGVPVYHGGTIRTVFQCVICSFSWADRAEPKLTVWSWSLSVRLEMGERSKS